MATISLPFPVSTNRLWEFGKRTHLTAAYKAWKLEAADWFIQQKRGIGEPIKGNFTYHIVLSEHDRVARNGHPRDGDNHGKCILDFLQAMNVIENDSLADAGSWSWGPLEAGSCFVRVYPKASLPEQDGRSIYAGAKA